MYFFPIWNYYNYIKTRPKLNIGQCLYLKTRLVEKYVKIKVNTTNNNKFYFFSIMFSNNIVIKQNFRKNEHKIMNYNLIK